jgi:Neuraminidase (sialidase)
MRFLLFFLVSVSNLIAQSNYQNIQIPSVDANYPYNGCEPSIAINPKNKDLIAAGSILQGYHYSKDGGKTWKSKQLKSKYGVYGDPVLIFDQTGRLYYFHLASRGEEKHLDRIVCQVSDKIEGSFAIESATKQIGTKVQDKHWVVVNPKTNVIYMTWTQFDAYESPDPKDSTFIMFSKSTNRGISWSEPKRISKFGGDCMDGDLTVEGAVPALGLNGEIYVSWAGPNGLVLQKSTDDGNTWLKEEKFIEYPTEGWDINVPGFYRTNGLPFLVSDMSNGPNRGTLYLNWSDQRNGNDNTDILLMKSTDGGETWSQPIKVNQDNTRSHQFFTCIAVDQTNGDLHFVYYDRSKYKSNDLQTDVVWCMSKDAGNTFQQKTISEKSFIPNENDFFGDYLGIAAHEKRVRPIWPRMDNRKISLWTALIDLDNE